MLQELELQQVVAQASAVLAQVQELRQVPGLGPEPGLEPVQEPEVVPRGPLGLEQVAALVLAARAQAPRQVLGLALARA